MATVEGQELNIDKIETDRHDEKSMTLSNGLIFQCKYDVCANVTTSTMFSPDGDVLSVLRAPELGNSVREKMEAMEDIINSHEAIEDQRDKALERCAAAVEAMQSASEVSESSSG